MLMQQQFILSPKQFEHTNIINKTADSVDAFTSQTLARNHQRTKSCLVLIYT